MGNRTKTKRSKEITSHKDALPMKTACKVYVIEQSVALATNRGTESHKPRTAYRIITVTKDRNAIRFKYSIRVRVRVLARVKYTVQESQKTRTLGLAPSKRLEGNAEEIMCSSKVKRRLSAPQQLLPHLCLLAKYPAPRLVGLIHC